LLELALRRQSLFRFRTFHAACIGPSSQEINNIHTVCMKLPIKDKGVRLDGYDHYSRAQPDTSGHLLIATVMTRLAPTADSPQLSAVSSDGQKANLAKYLPCYGRDGPEEGMTAPKK
jgi:hypothetical protein